MLWDLASKCFTLLQNMFLELSKSNLLTNGHMNGEYLRCFPLEISITTLKVCVNETVSMIE